MNTMTYTPSTTTTNYRIVEHISGDFTIVNGDEVLRDRYGNVRYFRTRSSARKTISRLRGNTSH